MSFKIAVLISGGGTTLKNLIEKRQAGLLPIEIGLVISSNSNAAGNQFARNKSIDLKVVERKAFDCDDDFSRVIFDCCRNANVDLVVMGGFLKKIVVPGDFVNRVINIHPSLIPDFCGQGMYGMHVHRAVIESGAKVSGCTVHFVDNEYDHGPIIAQEKVEVFPDDRPEELQARVFSTECELYPDVIMAIARGRISLLDGVDSSDD